MSVNWGDGPSGSALQRGYTRDDDGFDDDGDADLPVYLATAGLLYTQRRARWIATVNVLIIILALALMTVVGVLMANGGIR